MDFGKYLYEQEKKERAAKKHQHVITVKEVKFRINVDEHDYETKKKHVLRFLGEGDKVKATIFFRGREMTRQSLGRGILERLIGELGEKAVVEFRPRQEGNTMHVILAPPKVQQPQKKEKAAPSAPPAASPPPSAAQA
jgi:translation initiation factor IF-3